MGKYTELDNAAVEKTVDRIITDAIAQMVAHFHPRSIILAGSLARGEATILDRGGKPKFLSDCEITLVSNRYITPRRIRQKLVSITAAESEPKFVIGSSLALPVYPIIPLTPVLWKPTLWNYDLKYGSRTLYGKDYVSQMPDFHPEQIPAWEGIRLIFNRIAEALRYFPEDLSAPEQEQEAAFWMSKIIMACQDALLIAAGRYHVSSRMRNDSFPEVLGQNFPELEEKLPQFASLAAKATNYKLRGESFWGSTTELWFDAAEICDPVLRYLLHQHLNIEFNDYLELGSKFGKQPMLQCVMTLARRFSARSLILALPSVIRAGLPWVHLLYPAIAMVYFSLTRDGKVNKTLLEGARKTASLFTRVKPANGDPLAEWKYLKDEVHKLWYALGK